MDAQFGWVVDRKASFKKAVEYGKKAYELAPSVPLTNALLGQLQLYLRNHDKAMEHGRKAVELGPGNADTVAVYGLILVYCGQPEEAIPVLKRAMRLSPHYPVWYASMLGVAYTQTGNYAEAEGAFQEPIRRESLLVPSFVRLAILHALQDDMGKARFYVGELLKINPRFTLEHWAKYPPYRNKEDLERDLTQLRKAGLPAKAEGS